MAKTGAEITSAERQALLEAARAAAQHVYAPYSGYVVGAALLAADGRIFGGVNLENASYPVTLCAERVAMAKALSEGVRDFRAMLILTADGGTPCGMCRQFMSEFSPALPILLATPAGIQAEHNLAQLFPSAFVLDR